MSNFWGAVQKRGPHARFTFKKGNFTHESKNGLVTTLSGVNFVIAWILGVCEIYSMECGFCNTLYCSELWSLLQGEQKLFAPKSGRVTAQVFFRL